MHLNTKYISVALAVVLILSPAKLIKAQVRIHAHNDYLKPEPLTNAVKTKVFSVEADVFLYGNKLVVAHTRSEINQAKTLEALYINPIIALFKSNRGFLTPDTAYHLALVIDIKEESEKVLQYLSRLFREHRQYFDRTVNPHAVQVIISGDRGSKNNWISYSPVFYFDGRPYETYDATILGRIAMISDNFNNYIRDNKPGAMLIVRALADKVHLQGKPLRLWGAPDNHQTWSSLVENGVDIITRIK